MNKYDNGREAQDIKDRIKQSIHIDIDGCWIWCKKSINKWGYGKTQVGSRRDGSRKSVFVHRASFEAYKGKIPDGLTIDHLCKKTLCVNPDHLEAVTMTENNRRKRQYICNKCGGERIERYKRMVCINCYREYQRKYQREYKK